ncbi:uncharacterized protein RAG0_03610 [Rhynchosporium agropyri]|uniref:N-acetyltransferase domain-containing protein n=1 Tax=Rhynchosporium agropyri TaxID=914238 RepID=A0A1E1K571_9HELO|nr:uncharacterized protein RAG0_03610 [Rhynchosporium agropyri]
MASQFKISLLTPGDISDASTIFFASFNSAKAQTFFPPTASGKQWFADSITAALNDPSKGIIHVVVTDESELADGEIGGGRRKVVAHSKWVKHAGGKPPKWDQMWRKEPAEGVSAEMLEREFFAPMERQQERYLGERPHYYLETIATLPEYRKKGLASMLLHWGTDQADQLGWECYLNADEAAILLYQKHGFVVMPETDPETQSLPMARPVMKEFS